MISTKSTHLSVPKEIGIKDEYELIIVDDDDCELNMFLNVPDVSRSYIKEEKSGNTTENELEAENVDLNDNLDKNDHLVNTSQLNIDDQIFLTPKVEEIDIIDEEIEISNKALPTNGSIIISWHEKVKKQKEKIPTNFCLKKLLFECDYCKKKLSTRKKLVCHMKIHGKGLKCQQCEKSFTLIGNFRRHMKIHGEKKFECNYCNRKFIRKEGLAGHIRVHLGEKFHKVCNKSPYKCLNCNVKGQEMLQKPFCCPICHKHFAQSSYISRHMKKHTGEKPHTCKVCKVSFIQSGDLSKHMRRHTGEKPFECKYCFKKFSVKYALNRHLFLHKNRKPFSCSVCEKSFIRSSQLTTHMLNIHKEIMPFQCDYCKKYFTDKPQIVNHIKFLHYKEVEKVCPTEFSDILQVFIKDENMEGKKYQCSFCEKCFNNSGSLHNHVQTHGDKKEICKLCDKAFHLKSQLRRHIPVHCG